MRTIVCVKLSPDVQDIEVKPDLTISLDRAEWTFGEYDLPAVEAAVQIAEATEGSVTALSIGGSQLNNSKARKSILSRGPADLTLVIDDSLEDADTHQTACVLAASIRKLGEFDLVLCGTGSADLYAQQVGIQLGELLGVRTTNAVNSIEPQGDKVLVERALENVTEVLEIALPAVITVSPDIYLPRIPGMKDILAAGKKPVTEWTLADVLDGEAEKRSMQVLSTLAPQQVDRKQIICEGVSEETIQELIANLAKEGVI